MCCGAVDGSRALRFLCLGEMLVSGPADCFRAGHSPRQIFFSQPEAASESRGPNNCFAAIAAVRLRRANSRSVLSSSHRPARRSLARKAAVGCIADVDIAYLDGIDVGPVPRPSQRPLFAPPNSRNRPLAALWEAIARGCFAAVAVACPRRANSRLGPPSGRRPALLSLARKAAVACIADIDIADLDGSDFGPVPRPTTDR